MVLRREEIELEIENGNITVYPFSQVNLKRDGYELTLGSKYFEFRDLGRDLDLVDKDSLKKYLRETSDGKITLHPFKPVSVYSKEKIGFKKSLSATLEKPSFLGKLGIVFNFCPNRIPPGFGEESPARIVFTVMSCNPNPVILYPKTPLAKLKFLKTGQKDLKPLKNSYMESNTSIYPRVNGMINRILNRPVIIGITGLAASGKSKAAKIFSNLLDADLISMGEIVRNEVKKRGLEVTSKNTSKISKKIRKEKGSAVVAELLLDQKDIDKEENIVIDGIRSINEIDCLENFFDTQLFLVGVHASPKTRIKRHFSRNRANDVADKKDFLENRDEKEMGFGVHEALAKADYIITNEGSIDDLKKSVKDVLAKILGEKLEEKDGSS